MKNKQIETVILVISICVILIGVLLIIFPKWNATGSNIVYDNRYWASPEGLRIITNYVLGAVLFLSGVITFFISPMRFAHLVNPDR